MPAKQEPGSISAIRLREVTSTRLSTRFQQRRISRTSQSSVCASSSASTPATARGSPCDLKTSSADLGLVEAQMQQRVVEFARERSGQKSRALRRESRRRIGRRCGVAVRAR